MPAQAQQIRDNQIGAFAAPRPGHGQYMPLIRKRVPAVNVKAFAAVVFLQIIKPRKPRRAELVPLDQRILHPALPAPKHDECQQAEQGIRRQILKGEIAVDKRRRIEQRHRQRCQQKQHGPNQHRCGQQSSPPASVRSAAPALDAPRTAA